MKKPVHIVWILSLLILSVNFLACSKDPVTDPVVTPVPDPPKPQDTAKPAPKDTTKLVTSLTSFLPLEATGDDLVRISGKNFSGVTAVSFGGTNAKSFTLISDSVILAYVSAGSPSGNLSVTTTTGNLVLPGFIYYTPQQSFLVGNTSYGTLNNNALPSPNYDSSKYKAFIVKDTAAFFVRKINPNDIERNYTSFFYNDESIRSRYVDSPKFVILSGVVLQNPQSINGYGGQLYSFTSSPPLKSSVFARVVDTVLTIPEQWPLNGYIHISGTGVIKNGVVTSMDYFIHDSHGNSKTASLKKQ